MFFIKIYGSSLAMGSLCLSCIKRCTGLSNTESRGVLRWFNHDKYGSTPSSTAFFIIDFAIWTALSAPPLLWGYPGELVACSNCHFCWNALNASNKTEDRYHWRWYLGFHTASSVPLTLWWRLWITCHSKDQSRTNPNRNRRLSNNFFHET